MESFKLKLQKEIKDECGFVLKEYSVLYLYEDKIISEFGNVNYSEIRLQDLLNLINEYKENWLDVFCKIFDVEYEEAKAITSMIKDENTSYLYLQKINLEYKRGNGIGKEIVNIIKNDYPYSEIILYPYPIPVRWQLGFDSNYMNESKEKIVRFYKNCGFEYDSDKNVAMIHSLNKELYSNIN